jgi:spore germination protein KB
MKKDTLTSRNVIMLLILMMVGNNMILGFPGGVDQDTWVALLLSAVMALPLLLLYGRLVKLMPGRDIYEMAEAVFGRVGAIIVSVLFGLYCLHLTTFTLGNYTEFIHLNLLHHTPFVVTAMILTVACLYLAKSGGETLGKWSSILFVIYVAVMVFFSLFAVSQIDWGNLLPVMDHSIREISVVAAKSVPMPFGEMVLILALINGLEKKANPYKIFGISTGVAAILITFIFIRTCALLGTALLRTSFFPVYKAASLMKIGTFLERIEAAFAFLYLLIGITKIAAGIIAAARGVAKTFRMPSYQAMILPIALLAASLSSTLYPDIEAMFDSLDAMGVYSLFFQLVIPLVIWITAEVKAKRKLRNSYEIS